jgi:hypothetical protein
MHVAPDCGARVVLEEHMIEVLPVNRAIGIVHPVLGGEKMKLGTKRV